MLLSGAAPALPRLLEPRPAEDVDAEVEALWRRQKVEEGQRLRLGQARRQQPALSWFKDSRS